MSERLIVLNTGNGWHDTNTPTPGEVPQGEKEAIEFIKFIKNQKEDNKEEADNEKERNTTLVLVNTLWNGRFGEDGPETGENAALAAHLGFKAAFHTFIDDEGRTEEGEDEIGITVATDYPVLESKILRVGYIDNDDKDLRRNALSLKLKVSSEALRLASVSWSETDYHAQWGQMVRLAEALNGKGLLPVGPQIIAGAFNALDDHKTYKGLARLGSNVVRAGAALTEGDPRNSEDRGPVEKTLVTLDRRRAMPHMRTLQYTDADAGPTSLLNLDRVFFHEVRKDSASVLGNLALSNRRAIVFDFRMPPKALDNS
jgi:endonuclease/exonuclease/phosphatase family metal-dependent hydrolase